MSLFVSERDRYIDGPTIFADAQAAAAQRQRCAESEPTAAALSMRRALRPVLWQGAGHGEFMSLPERRRELVQRVLGHS